MKTYYLSPDGEVFMEDHPALKMNDYCTEEAAEKYTDWKILGDFETQEDAEKYADEWDI